MSYPVTRSTALGAFHEISTKAKELLTTTEEILGCNVSEMGKQDTKLQYIRTTYMVPLLCINEAPIHVHAVVSEFLVPILHIALQPVT